MELIHDSSAAIAYLTAARKHHSQAEIASRLGVTIRTVRRWEARQTTPPNYVVHALQGILPLQLPLPREAEFTFVDLFAGIGGIRLAFEAIGGECVFTSEWDSYAQKTYLANFPGTHPIAGDITRIGEDEIPDHDVLLAGFPCQPFSIAGVSKKNALGRKHGFACETQGTLFFDIARIIAKKRPRAFLLENVKNLQSHDKGRTFEVITKTLRDELGYHLHVRVVNAAHWVPQHRERVLIVGFKDETGFDWNALRTPPRGVTRIKDVLHRTDGTEPFLPWDGPDGNRFISHASKKVQARYTLTPNLWAYLQAYKEKHAAKGNGFGFGLIGPNDIARTLSARYYKDGSEILIRQSGSKPPRRLTPRECARIMGFPDSFKIPVSDTRAYKQFGNSVAVPVIEAAAQLMKPFLSEEALVQRELSIAA